jgi:tmRNA-binding protein
MSDPIKKLILSNLEVKEVQNAITNKKYTKVKGSIQTFASKDEYKGKTILQRSIALVDKKGNILLTQRASQELSGPRITTGHSILVSSSTHDEAFEKLSNVPEDKALLYSFLTKNENYVFDIYVYQVDDLSNIKSCSQDKEVLVEKSKVPNLLSDKKMELDLYKQIQDIQSLC